MWALLCLLANFVGVVFGVLGGLGVAHVVLKKILDAGSLCSTIWDKPGRNPKAREVSTLPFGTNRGAARMPGEFTIWDKQGRSPNVRGVCTLPFGTNRGATQRRGGEFVLCHLG